MAAQQAVPSQDSSHQRRWAGAPSWLWARYSTHSLLTWGSFSTGALPPCPGAVPALAWPSGAPLPVYCIKTQLCATRPEPLPGTWAPTGPRCRSGEREGYGLLTGGGGLVCEAAPNAPLTCAATLCFESLGTAPTWYLGSQEGLPPPAPGGLPGHGRGLCLLLPPPSLHRKGLALLWGSSPTHTHTAGSPGGRRKDYCCSSHQLGPDILQALHCRDWGCLSV